MLSFAVNCILKLFSFSLIVSIFVLWSKTNRTRHCYLFENSMWLLMVPTDRGTSIDRHVPTHLILAKKHLMSPKWRLGQLWSTSLELPVKCVDVCLIDATFSGCREALFSVFSNCQSPVLCSLKFYKRQAIHAKSMNRNISKNIVQDRKEGDLSAIFFYYWSHKHLDHCKKMAFTALAFYSASVSCIFWDVICACSWLHTHASTHTELISVLLSSRSLAAKPRETESLHGEFFHLHSCMCH